MALPVVPMPLLAAHKAHITCTDHIHGHEQTGLLRGMRMRPAFSPREGAT